MRISPAERTKLLELILAMVNLYGIAPYAKVAELWHRTYPESTPVTVDFLGRMRIGDQFFVHGHNDFAHESLFWDDDEDYVKLRVQQRGKPYYEPPTEELLKYADDYYYEKTPAFANLLMFVQKEGLAYGEMASELVDDIQLITKDLGLRMQDVLDEFERRDIVFKDETQVNRLMPLILDLANHSRIWANRGFTPLEMRRLSGPRAGQAVSSGKTGRNDPCPCGSGKKYKNCCGKTTVGN